MNALRLGLLACVCLFALRARAEESRVSLSWSVPTGMMCPSRALLASDVEALTGRRFVDEARDADVRLFGQVDGSTAGVVARIEARAADGALVGTRQLSAEDCPALRRPLGLVLALLVDEPAPERVRARWRSALGAQFAIDSTVMPRVSPGIGLLATLDPRAWLRLRLGVSYWLPERVETPRGEGARLSGVSGELALCPRLAGGARLGLWLCLAAQAGRVIAEPRGLTMAERKSLGFGDGSLELAGSFAIGRAELWLAAGPALSLARPELYFERSDDARVAIHRAPTFGGIFRLAMTIDLTPGNGPGKTGE